MNHGRAVSFGDSVSHDDELRICGDVKGKRVLELGIFPRPTEPHSGVPTSVVPNSVIMAQRGARAISIDPSRDAIAQARAAAAHAEVAVEFHEGDLADLGFLMNSVLDLAVCVHHIDANTDVARLFRQVHRVLRPEAGFVFAVTHPMSAVFDGNDPTARRPYGSTTPTIGEFTMALQRANFTIDVMYELSPLATSPAQSAPIAPTVLVVRARKLGS